MTVCYWCILSENLTVHIITHFNSINLMHCTISLFSCLRNVPKESTFMCTQRAQYSILPWSSVTCTFFITWPARIIMTMHNQLSSFTPRLLFHSDSKVATPCREACFRKSEFSLGYLITKKAIVFLLHLIHLCAESPADSNGVGNFNDFIQVGPTVMFPVISVKHLDFCIKTTLFHWDLVRYHSHVSGLCLLSWYSMFLNQPPRYDKSLTIKTKRKYI